MSSSLAGFQGDLRLARTSFDAAPRAWAGVTVVCVALTLIATWVGDRIGGHPGYLFGEFRLEGLHAGVMTAATAFLLGAAGLALFAVSWLFSREARSRRLVLPWAIAAAGLFVMGADDLLFVHEILASRLAARGVPRAIGENLALGLYVVGTLLVLPRLLDTVRQHWRSMFPLAFGFATFALSVVVEIVPAETAGGTVSAIAALVDRTGKVIGSVMMFAFAQILLIGVASEPTTAKH
jgi:hypothetical protein